MKKCEVCEKEGNDNEVAQCVDCGICLCVEHQEDIECDLHPTGKHDFCG